MTDRYNTGNPVPSSSVRDIADNAKNLDEFSNSKDHVFTNRIGEESLTISGIADRASKIGKVYKTVDEALPDIVSGRIPDGTFFYVRNPGDINIIDEYVNNSGVPVLTGNGVPNSSAVLVRPRDGSDLYIHRDAHGYVLYKISSSGGIETKAMSASDAGLRLGAINLNVKNESSLSIVDKRGFVGMMLKNDGTFLSSNNKSQAVNVDDNIARRNAANLARALAVAGEFNSEIQSPYFDYNFYLSYGQSIETGTEGWPALSKVSNANFGNLMLGGSVRPNHSTAAAWNSVGTETLQPMIAVTQGTGADAATVLTAAEEAALPPGSPNSGEAPIVGAMNMLRQLYLQYRMLPADPEHLFVAASAGVGGQTIEALSKGAAQGYYNRPLQVTGKVKAIADAATKSFGIPTIFFMQGEYNYRPEFGGDTTKAGYKGLLLKLRNDMVNDFCVGIAAQDKPPAFITYQTGGAFTRDTDDLSIGMAQLELSNEQDNWYLASPYYPYTDKNAHLDPNGYRWLGMQLGKVAFRVNVLKQNWKPTSPTNATIKDKEILIDYHVPHPPLVFDTPYVVLTPTNYPDKGFTVIDSIGVVPISSVDFAAETIIKITLSRVTTGVVLIRYADYTYHNGNGNVRDSDPMVAIDKYKYNAGAGQYPAANIPTLVDRPYPLHNWSVAFSIQANYI